MAVDSQRNTFHTNRVSPRDLNQRITAQSYRSDIVQAIRQIQQTNNWKRLEAICCMPINQGRSPVYATSGRPCLKTRNVVDIVASKDDIDWVSEKFAKEHERFCVHNENLLLTRSGVGSIGRVSIYFGNDKPLTNEELFKIAIDSKYDAAYVCCFLVSWWGERAIEQGISGTTGQIKLVTDHVRSLPIPIPDRAVQNYIGDKVRLAEKLRERSKQLEDKLKQLELELIPALRPETFTKKGWQVKKKFLEENRLDPAYYKLNYIQAQQQTLGKDFINLGSICPKMRYGISTKADYVSEEKGVLLVRGLNLTRNSLSLSKCVYLDRKHLEITKSNRLKAGELLITRSGTVGIVTVVPELLNDSIFGSFIIAMSAKKDWKPEFIAWFLNSWLGQLQVERLKNGAIQQNINIEELSSIRIWNASIHIQELITDYILQWQLCQKISNKLTSAAKYLVEALIEGKLTETELKEAQTALQKGNIEPDKAILAKLTRQGYDIPDEPALFPDLDALYEVTKEINLTSDS